MSLKADDDGAQKSTLKYVLGTKKDMKETKRVLTDEDLQKLMELDEDHTMSL